MKSARGGRLVLGLVCGVLMSARAGAQDDPFGSEPDVEGEASDAPEAAPGEPEAEAADAPAEPESEPAPPASADANLGAGLDVSAGAETNADAAVLEDSEPAPAPAPARSPAAAASERIAGSHIPRPQLQVDGTLVLDGPLRTTFEPQGALQIRRQLGGVGLPDTTAALGHGALGTSSLVLRNQPTLILLNGRRLVSAPFWGAGGADFVDINQLPHHLDLAHRDHRRRGRRGCTATARSAGSSTSSRTGTTKASRSMWAARPPTSSISTRPTSR